MLFVDGENLTLEGQKIASQAGLALTDGRHYSKDNFLWKPDSDPKSDTWLPNSVRGALLPHGERAFYYTSVTGSDELKNSVRQRLWDLGFQPEVFRKPKGSKSKGVDITLTKDVLCHAFQDNYDVAVLVAGDGDYIPLIAEIKRMGKIVCLCFFADNGLNSELRLAVDYFLDLKDSLLRSWQVHQMNA